MRSSYLGWGGKTEYVTTDIDLGEGKDARAARLRLLGIPPTRDTPRTTPM